MTDILLFIDQVTAKRVLLAATAMLDYRTRESLMADF